MIVVFRVDASTDVGSGHLVRCLTLAKALRDRGVRIHFVSADHPGNLLALLKAAGMRTTVLPATATDQGTDAELTIDAIGAPEPDWLVVDHYGLDAKWEGALRNHAGRILVIDDLANREHDCDVLLDQNFSDDGIDRYGALTPPGCRLLIGPRYALLGAEYAAHRAELVAHPVARERILVFFGGTDFHNLTGLALEAISIDGLRDQPADIVVGANNPFRAEIEAAARRRPDTVVHGLRPHLADLLAAARLSLGAGGTTTWERLCLGVPSVVVSLAANQVATCEALARAGYIDYLGPWETVGVPALSHASLAKLGTSLDASGRSTLPDLVDGLGSTRVCEIMLSAIGK